MADPTPREFKLGDRVMAEFSHGEGATSGLVTRHEGPIIALNDRQAQVQCAGYLAWIDRDVLNFMDDGR